MESPDPSLSYGFWELVTNLNEQIDRALATLEYLFPEAGEPDKREEAQLRALSEGEGSQLGAFLILTVQSLEDTLTAFEDQLPASQTPISGSPASPLASFQIPAWLQKVKDWIKKNLKPKLKKISQGAWKIIANLLTPKSWSIKGGLGTGFLGLANADLEITFGS